MKLSFIIIIFLFYHSVALTSLGGASLFLDHRVMRPLDIAKSISMKSHLNLQEQKAAIKAKGSDNTNKQEQAPKQLGLEQIDFLKEVSIISVNQFAQLAKLEPYLLNNLKQLALDYKKIVITFDKLTKLSEEDVVEKDTLNDLDRERYRKQYKEEQIRSEVIKLMLFAVKIIDIHQMNQLAENQDELCFLQKISVESKKESKEERILKINKLLQIAEKFKIEFLLNNEIIELIKNSYISCYELFLITNSQHVDLLKKKPVQDLIKNHIITFKQFLLCDSGLDIVEYLIKNHIVTFNKLFSCDDDLGRLVDLLSIDDLLFIGIYYNTELNGELLFNKILQKKLIKKKSCGKLMVGCIAVQQDPYNTQYAIQTKDSEWVVAHAIAVDKIFKGVQLPFLISKRELVEKNHPKFHFFDFQHDFLVLRHPDGKTPYILGVVANANTYYSSVQTNRETISVSKTQEGVLGIGSFGMVTIVQWEDGSADVVKICRYDNPMLDRIDKEEEISALKKLGFFIERFDSNGDLYIIQKKLPGISLRKYLRDTDNTLQKEFIALQAALSIQKMHDLNIIHGDIKPDNFLIDYKYATATNINIVTAIDFGLSVQLENSNDKVRLRNLGTAFYKAPEIQYLARDVDGYLIENTGQWMWKGNAICECFFSKKSDIFALGIMFIRDLNFKSLSQEANALAHKMIAQAPEDRPTIDEVVVSLQNITKNIKNAHQVNILQKSCIEHIIEIHNKKTLLSNKFFVAIERLNKLLISSNQSDYIDEDLVKKILFIMQPLPDWLKCWIFCELPINIRVLACKELNIINTADNYFSLANADEIMKELQEKFTTYKLFNMIQDDIIRPAARTKETITDDFLSFDKRGIDNDNIQRLYLQNQMIKKIDNLLNSQLYMERNIIIKPLCTTKTQLENILQDIKREDIGKKNTFIIPMSLDKKGGVLAPIQFDSKPFFVGMVITLNPFATSLKKYLNAMVVYVDPRGHKINPSIKSQVMNCFKDDMKIEEKHAIGIENLYAANPELLLVYELTNLATLGECVDDKLMLDDLVEYYAFCCNRACK